MKLLSMIERFLTHETGLPGIPTLKLVWRNGQNIGLEWIQVPAGDNL